MKRWLIVVVSAALGALVLVLTLRSCRRTVEAAGTSDAAGDGGAMTCKRSPTGTALGADVIGEVSSTPDGFAVGVVRSGQFAVALLKVPNANGQDLSVQFSELGKATGDLPPPRPFVMDRRVFAVVEDTARTLKVAPLGGAELLSIPTGRDESPAFDAVGFGERALVVWDEDGGEAGVIKVALVRASLEAVVVSSGGDVESPRAFVREGGGFWVAWLSRRRDLRGESDADTLETAGEDRAFSWVEIAHIDENGHRVGDVHKATPEIGHAAMFELEGHDLLVRDDTEAHAGEGGRLLRVSVHPDGTADSPVNLVATGVGRADPDLAGAWVVYTDVADAAHLLPLAAGAASVGASPVSPASATPNGAGGPLAPVFDGKRVLAMVRQKGDELGFLAASAVDGAEAHIISCAALNR